jgi:hypothetical protein
MESIFTDSKFSSQNYDKALMGWANLEALQSNVKLGAEGLTYCKSEAARNKLINTFGWQITDAGKSCSSQTDIVSLSFATQTAEAIIDAESHNITIEVSKATTIASLPLMITLSPGATSSPANGAIIDFTNQVSILVTAEDGTTTQEWKVKVTQEPALGLPEQDKIELMVYPNPFQEVLYIKSDKPFSISLSDMRGTTLRQEKSEGELQLNLVGLSSGMYLLVIENEDGVTTKKVIKK